MRIELTSDELNKIVVADIVKRMNIDLDGKEYTIDSYTYKWCIEISDRLKDEEKF